MIEAGEELSQSRLLPFLSLASKADRSRVNFELASAYFERYHQKEHPRDQAALRNASACADRALLLSRYSPEVLPLLIEIQRALGDVVAIKHGLKTVGIEQAAVGNFDAALRLFNRWAYADAEFTGLDAHTFDSDILACVERIAAFRRLTSKPEAAPLGGRRIRLAYLMEGLTDAGSVLVKIDRVFAHFHDKSRFEVAYFTVKSESDIAASSDAQTAVRDIRADGCQVFIPVDGGTMYERMLFVGESIRRFQPDVLITAGGLANFYNFFVACLKPAPVTIALHQGPSAQFSWHSFDHSISWFRSLMVDCPANCSYVPLELELPPSEHIDSISRAELNIPVGATVVASGGRAPKFQDASFWQAVDQLLSENDDLYWVFLGLSEDQVPSGGSMLTLPARSKIRFTGWVQDYLRYLAIADMFVDSYPLGGGVLLAEASRLGLPSLSFEHDYITPFDNSAGSGGEEIVGLRELIIPRGDFKQLQNRILELARDEESRRRLGKLCAEQVRQNFGDPARMVRRCEEIYESVLIKQPEEVGVPRDDAATAHAEINGLDAYKQSLIEREDILNRREADLMMRENRHNDRALVQLSGKLRRRWHKFRRP